MRGTGYSGPWAELFFYVGAIAAALWAAWTILAALYELWKGDDL
jgi:hypothetical protein